MTRMTIAAFPIVEETLGPSGAIISPRFGLRAGEGGHTVCNNIACNVVAEGEVASDGHENVYGTRDPNTGNNDGSGPKMRVVPYFIEDGEHLRLI